MNPHKQLEAITEKVGEVLTAAEEVVEAWEKARPAHHETSGSSTFSEDDFMQISGAVETLAASIKETDQ